MYVELTPQDTVRDLRQMLIDAVPGFEFPRKDLYNYTIKQYIKKQDELEEDDFSLGLIWDEIDDEDILGTEEVVVEGSEFNEDLTPEEINILAILMMCAWVQRQVTSIENTRMKYSGSDFKMTSQANHLSKLVSLLNECQRQSLHMQRLYGRRKKTDNGYESNWSILREKSGI